MNTHKKTALVLGATGLTGGCLLQVLLKEDNYEKVKLFSRIQSGISHPKIEEHVVDVLNLIDYGSVFTADVVFCCIGTTKNKTPNKELYRKIDYGIPVAAARLCQMNSIPIFIVVSALGADAQSSIFYNRTKGEIEEKILEFRIPKTHILQPSLISGQRKEIRWGERIFKHLMKGMNYVLVGSWKKYRSISPDAIATCMLWLSLNPFREIRIESDRIKELVSNSALM